MPAGAKGNYFSYFPRPTSSSITGWRSSPCDNPQIKRSSHLLEKKEEQGRPSYRLSPPAKERFYLWVEISTGMLNLSPRWQIWSKEWTPMTARIKNKLWTNWKKLRDD